MCVPQQRQCLKTYLLISFDARSGEGACIRPLHQQPDLLVNGGRCRKDLEYCGFGFLQESDPEKSEDRREGSCSDDYHKALLM